MISLEWKSDRVSVVKQALNYWIGAAEHKVKRTGERAEGHGALFDMVNGWTTTESMPESLKADIQHINTMLPLRLAEAREALHDITTATRSAAGL